MRTLSFVALALSTALAGPALAQYRPATPAARPVTAADQLAAVMRRVAAAPTDTYALLSAGELSIKLDDMSAAAAFFARVEKIDPRNGRAKAGMAAILVRAERPGEALRYFQMAEGFGHPASRFASDRGLAYDLLGEQERAQRDYRLALRGGPDDETIRRYALSLGISGQQAPALEQLEPLTRRQDRAAWRVRAFVLAMNGDVAGASTIAATVMPRGMASGLQPFFERLPTLPAADRAFAVHFGEVRPTPARLADLRMKPILGPLGPDPFPPVRVAVARAAPPVALASRADRRRGSARRVAVPVERRALLSAAPRVTAPVGRTAIPAGRSVLTASAPRVPAAVASAPRIPVPVVVERSPEPVAVASAAPTAIDAPAAAALQALAQTDRLGPVRPGATVTPPFQTDAQVQVASAAPVRPGFGVAPPLGGTPAPVAPAPVPTVAATASVQPGYSLPGTPIASPGSSTPVEFARSFPSVVPEPIPSASVTPATVASVSAPATTPPVEPASSGLAPQAVGGSVQTALAPQPAVAAPAPVIAAAPGAGGIGTATPGFASFSPVPAAELAAAATPASVTAVRSEDSILARIVASITIPGEELGVVQPERRVAASVVPPATAQVLAAGEAKAASQKADRAAAARTIAAARRPAVDPKPTARKGRAADVAEEAKPGARTRRGGRTELAAKGDAKLLTPAEKRLVDRKKAADEKAELAKAEKAKGKGEPERIWVQVAGGASEGDLPRAWSAAQKKAAVLKGRVAYVTPLRATNRVVTGPFKTEAEARAFVNQLARQGVSAFQFTSATGQRMTKLSSK